MSTTPMNPHASTATGNAKGSADIRFPDISLVLATVGRTSELGRLFESLAAQTFSNFELVVVDQNMDARLLPHLERARYLGIAVKHLKHHPANLAAARNAGIEAARGRWIGFPDDDCWYDPHLLERVAARFMLDDNPAGVVVRWVEQGEQPLVAANLTWERARAFRDVPVSSITLFCERSLFRKIGGFDARLGVGQWFGAGEETDFVLRALRSRAVLTYEPLAEVHHAVNPATPDAGPDARMAIRHRARGTGALYAKHRLPLWVILRGLAAPVMRPLLKGSFGGDLAHGYAVVRGRLDGLLRWRHK
ncbi:glycosyltransferase family 2 protein [Noviherbaspirillum cavernae]|uniref:Glycosyltransferase family 2 protein n=1 Tax=Noviherbaspirillum cavernae TaxID=2320862 RepID=A0A418X000_9BURK|nr:glycosyltransferase family A protein [Noviherbaspirillum cavernae]RJG05772.1 glycosyltransferase family 2 protein [Noviherbaspirillum cavernae]